MTINMQGKEKSLNIEGLDFRNFRENSDFEIMAEIFNASNVEDDIKEATSAEKLAHYYDHKKDVDRYKDIIFAEISGKAVAYGHTFWEQEHEGPLVYFVAGFVSPEWRRKKIGTTLFAMNEDRSREVAATHDANKKKVLHGWAASTEIGRNQMFINRGYEESRYFYLMLRDLSKAIQATELPSGLEIRPSNETHFRKIFEASNEAFRDHWGHVEQSEDDYQRWVKDPERDESIWKVAWDGDQVAGMILNYVHADENKKLGVNWGWTDPISVRRPWRRKGLATALLMESLKLLKEKGFSHAALGVDTKNPSGALGLYESAGYIVDEHWTDYRRKMD
jgi:GNAT superfamily N-acetyltransferase